MPDERRHEPWPWIVAGLLLTMMAVSTAFAWVAHWLPDPVVVDERYEASGGAEGFRPHLEASEEAPVPTGVER